MDIPDFIEVTQAEILSDLIADYEQRYFEMTQQVRVLYPLEVEYLVLESIAYKTYLYYLKIQSAALQNLAQFATYPVLDYICQPFGVTRDAAQYAAVTATLTLVGGHGPLVIPAGIRVQSQDGQATFVLQANTPVATGVTTVVVDLVCDTPGMVGNGYIAGKISVILDPQPYLSGAVNNATTAGGAEIESDDSLRSRLYLAPAAFSCAGPEDAYKYWAKTASQLITDVEVNNGSGGVVNIYPLVPGGTTSDVILEAVAAVCSAKNRRPTSITVNVLSPTVVNYAINIDYYVYSSYPDPAGLQAQGLAALQAIVNDRASLLGVDVNLSALIAAASVPDVKNGISKVVVNSPVADVVLNKTQVGICTGIVFNLVGFDDDK